MPSLRRTLSTPAVRSSPYSTSSSTTRQTPRRSSGSETAGRRVLADIDWWLVTEGQSDHDEETNDNVVIEVQFTTILLFFSINLVHQSVPNSPVRSREPSESADDTEDMRLAIQSLNLDDTSSPPPLKRSHTDTVFLAEYLDEPIADFAVSPLSSNFPLILN